MSFNNTIGEKFKFQDLPGVPDNQKLTATKFNTLVDFQNSPVQQISGSLNDTAIVIDGTKNYATTITVAGATRTITASGSGHKQGNNIKQRYTFDVDCTITLSGFDATGNNTGVIAPISAGTYDFIYQSNRNGINLIVLENIWKVNGSNIYFIGGNVIIGGTIADKILHLESNNPALLLEDDSGTKAYFSHSEDSTYFSYNRDDIFGGISNPDRPSARFGFVMEDGSGQIVFGVGNTNDVIAPVRMTIFGDGNIEVVGNILSDGQITVQGKVVTFTATPTFDLDDGNVQEMILTSNVTSLTLSNKLDAGNYLIYLIQDGTGGHTIPTPDSSWGTETDSSVDPANFLTGANDRNLINVAVSPSGFAEYSIETHNI